MAGERARLWTARRGQLSSGSPQAVERDPAARGSALLFWAQLAGNSGLFVALVIVTRALGPSGRGTIAFITVAAILLARVARLGVSEATTIFTAQRPLERPALLTNLVLSVSTSTALGASLVCLALAALPASLRPNGIGSEELALLGLGALASAFADAGYTFLLGCSRFRLHAFTTGVTAWLYVAVVAAIEASTGLTVASAALAWIVVQLLKGFFMLAVSASDVGLGVPDGALLGETVRFGVRAWFGTLSDALNDRLDQVIAAFIASQAVLGFYSVAVNASEILLYLPGAAATALLPVAARSEARARVEGVLRAFRSVMLVSLGCAALGAVLGPLLVPLVFGDPFQESVTPFLLLLPAALGYVALGIFSSALVASGAPGRSSLGSLVSLALTTALDFVLIPRYGASGAAAAASIGYLAGGGAALALCRRWAAFQWGALFRPEAGDLDLLRALARPLTHRTKGAVAQAGDPRV
jgi:O-antigen/teichoic acid export membrane protein